jgi:hypothetical protein
MPLNVQNKTYVTVDDELKQSTTPRQPKKHTPYFKYIMLGLFIVIVVSSSVFLVFIYILGRQEIKLPAQQVTINQPIDTSTTTLAATPPIETKETQPPVNAPPSLTQPRAYYTVYIAAYDIKPPASDDSSRWNEAGYISSVVEANKYYSVALGKYETAEEARAFAEEMFDAFENGYFIGKIK